MLPAWATIVLSVIAALAGVAGGVWTTERRIGFEREERLRERQVDAADELSTGLIQALNATKALQAIVQRDILTNLKIGPVRSASRTEATRTADEVHNRLARVQLLFGQDSDAAECADAGVRAVKQALDELRKVSTEEINLRDADESLKLVAIYLGEFNTAALKAVT